MEKLTLQSKQKWVTLMKDRSRLATPRYLTPTSASTTDNWCACPWGSQGTGRHHCHRTLGWPRVRLVFSMRALWRCFVVFNVTRNNFLRLYCDSCHISKHFFNKQPWLVWLSGLSASLQTKGSPVQFPVRAHAWVSGQVPIWGVYERRLHIDVFLPPFLPHSLSLKINKMFFKKQIKTKNW